MNEFAALAWQYHETHVPQLIGACKSIIKSKRWRSAVSISEAMGEIAIRLPDIMRCYKPERGCLDAHVMVNVRMYLYKYCKQATEGPRAVRTGAVVYDTMTDVTLAGLSAAPDTECDTDERVLILLNDLSPVFQWILLVRIVHEHSVADIAGALGVSPAAVRQLVTNALEAARESTRVLRALEGD